MRNFLFAILSLLFSNPALAANAPITIDAIAYTTIEGPAHHGLAITTSGIDSPQLTAYEIHIKEDTGDAYGTYFLYANDVKPFDGKTINLPYRSENYSLQAGKKYCLSVRAVYGKDATSWSEKCDVTVDVPSSDNTDLDNDGLTDTDEYTLGTDPNNNDSDGDQIADGNEVDNDMNPNKDYYGKIMVRTELVDFGIGDALGAQFNQHSYIEIQNTGDDYALIDSVTITGVTGTNAAESFKVGSLPKALTNITPNSTVRIPVSFLPKVSGVLEATVQIVSTNNDGDIAPVTLKGIGAEVPTCTLSSSSIDFGSVAVNDTEITKQEITITNGASSVAQISSEDEDDLTQKTAFSFSVKTSSNEIVPGLRAFSLAYGKSLTLPIIFKHTTPGEHIAVIEIESPTCGSQTINVTATAY